MPNMPSIDKFADDELEDVKSCPFCGNNERHTLFEEKGFPYEECESCELIYLSVRPRQTALGKVYREGYNANRNVKWERWKAAKQLQLLGLPRRARVFEDGSGIGSFVRVAQEAGHKVSGCDLGEESVARAKTLNDVDLLWGRYDDASIRPGSLDAFVAFNLLSHLYAPWDYLRDVADLLKPGGVLMLRTGDRSGRMKDLNQGQWSAPEHVMHFNRRNLKQMIEKAGLEWVWLKPAFDSDYPYLGYPRARRQDRILSRVAGHCGSMSVRIWNILGLPKDDVYILARRHVTPECLMEVSDGLLPAS